MRVMIENGRINGKGFPLDSMDLRPGLIVFVPGDADRPTFKGTVERIWTKKYQVDGATYSIDWDGRPIVIAKENGLPTFYAPSIKVRDIPGN